MHNNFIVANYAADVTVDAAGSVATLEQSLVAERALYDAGAITQQQWNQVLHAPSA